MDICQLFCKVFSTVLPKIFVLICALLAYNDEPAGLNSCEDTTVQMLRRSLAAFVNHDADTARQVVAEDDEVDNLYNRVFRELLTFMIEDPKTITRATRLIWVAHNLERSADRVTNICERIVFIVTGKMEEIGASKY